MFPADALPWVAVLFGELPPPEGELEQVLRQAGPGFFAAALEALDTTGADLKALARELKARTGRRGAELYMPLRIALTGRRDGPELAPLLAALPDSIIRSRLRALASST